MSATPSLPDPKDTTRFLQAVKQTIEIREGRRGKRDSNGQYPERFVTLGELPDLVRSIEAVVTALGTAVSAAMGFGSPSTKVISGGAITVSGTNYFRHHSIDTEGAAATDDLTTINGGHAGELLLIQPLNDARTVVVKNGTDIVLGIDFTMNNTADKMLLKCKNTGVWEQISRSSGGS